MDELLARHTKLPIQLVTDGVVVEADHVYLIPPRMEMIISEGRLLLSERAPTPEFTLPIDVFFRSLARDCGPRAVAIVLSGGGSDGSRGIRDVRDAGGLVIVQDVGHGSVRRHAEDGPRRRRRELGAAAPGDASRPHPAQGEPPQEPRTGRRGRAALVDPAAAPRGIDAVYHMLEEQFGIDFTHYKPSTITRRIERRLALAQSTNIDEYVERLRNDRNELDVLYRDLLIGVTRFFRDRGGLRDPRDQGPARAPGARAAERAGAHLGGGVRDGRGGLLARHRAAGSDAGDGRAAREDLRHRRAPRLARARHARDLRGRRPGERLSRAPRAVLRPHRRRLSGGARSAQDDRVRAAQRHEGRPLHAGRPHHLPQPAHLPAAGRAAEDPGAVSLRAEAQGQAVPRTERDHRLHGPRVPGGRQALAPLRQGERHPDRPRRPLEPAGAAGASLEHVGRDPRAAGAAHAAAGRLRRAPRRGHAAQPARDRPRRAGPRLQWREPVPAHARRSPGAGDPRRGRHRAEDGPGGRHPPRPQRRGAAGLQGGAHHGAARGRARTARAAGPHHRPVRRDAAPDTRAEGGTPHVLIEFGEVGGPAGAGRRGRPRRSTSTTSRASSSPASRPS